MSLINRQKTAYNIHQRLGFRRVIFRSDLALNPGMDIQDGMLTTRSERTYRSPESQLLREFPGAPADTIDCPTESPRQLSGPTRQLGSASRVETVPFPALFRSWNFKPSLPSPSHFPSSQKEENNQRKRQRERTDKGKRQRKATLMG